MNRLAYFLLIFTVLSLCGCENRSGTSDYDKEKALIETTIQSSIGWTGVLEKRNGSWVIVQQHFSFAVE